LEEHYKLGGLTPAVWYGQPFKLVGRTLQIGRINT